MSDYDLGITWNPDPNEGNEPQPVPFVEGIATITWTFKDGSRLELEKNPNGYLLGGKIGDVHVRDDDWEDLYFPDTDSLLDFFRKHGLLKLLSKKPEQGEGESQ